MAEVAKTEAKKEEKMVTIINQGHGTVTTSMGPLIPGSSIAVPEFEATSLTKYNHIVLASKVVKNLPELESMKKENVELKAQVKALELKLKDFLGAQTKKDLETLQEKHGEKAPVEPKA